jgi:hypothetical protein
MVSTAMGIFCCVSNGVSKWNARLINSNTFIGNELLCSVNSDSHEVLIGVLA